MQSREVEAFLSAAAAYCELIDSCRLFEEEKNFRILLRILSNLYTKALDLPEVEAEEERSINLDFPLPEVKIKHYNVYSEIFDPYHDETPVKGCLNDDIIDIYRDIKNGLLLYEQGHRSEAVWEWKFGFEVHWGEHATSAIRALHFLIYQLAGNTLEREH